MKKVINLVIFFSYFNLYSQSIVKEIFNSPRKEYDFYINDYRCTLKEIQIKDKSAFKVCWVKIPNNLINLKIKEISTNLNFKDIKKFTKLDDLIILSGGFYDLNRQPEGLLIIDKTIKSPYKDFNQGGFLLSNRRGIYVYPISAYTQLNWKDVDFAVQSLPIIVRNSKNEILPNSLKKSNRIGIGLNNENDIIICVAFDTNSEALSLFELGELLSTPENKGGPGADIFIGLDGGPSINFYIPSINYQLIGSNDEVFISNIIQISKK